MRLFIVKRCGDPYNRHGYDVQECEKSFDDRFVVFRGDISPMHGRDRTIRYLRRNYPGCKIRVEK